jgi:hypothetical protein
MTLFMSPEASARDASVSLNADCPPLFSDMTIQNSDKGVAKYFMFCNAAVGQTSILYWKDCTVWPTKKPTPSLSNNYVNST